jgi:hypothetical protein
VPIKRIPCAKPSTELTFVEEQRPIGAIGQIETFYSTKWSKTFVRVEQPGGGVQWYQIVRV